MTEMSDLSYLRKPRISKSKAANYAFTIAVNWCMATKGLTPDT